MSYILMCKEALEDMLRFQQDGNAISIDSVEMETVNGEELIRMNLSGNIPAGKVRMIIHREINPGTASVTHRTEIKSY